MCSAPCRLPRSPGIPTRDNADTWFSDATLYGAEKWDKTTELANVSFNWEPSSGYFNTKPWGGWLKFEYPSHIYLNVGETLQGAGYMGHMTANYGGASGSDWTDFRVMLSSATWGETSRPGFSPISELISNYGHQGTVTEGTKLRSSSSSHFDFSNDARGSDNLISYALGDNEDYQSEYESMIVWRNNTENGDFNEYVLLTGTAESTGEVTFNPTGSFSLGAAQRYSTFVWRSNSGARLNKAGMTGDDYQTTIQDVAGVKYDANGTPGVEIKVTVYDKSELNSLIAAADADAANNYANVLQDGQTVEQFTAALAEAKRVLADREVTQDEIDAAATGIGDKMTLLVNANEPNYNANTANTGFAQGANTFNAIAYHYADAANGGYGNLVYASPANANGDETSVISNNGDFFNESAMKWKMFIPKTVVMVYDGVNEAYFPAQVQEISENKWGISNNRAILYLASNNINLAVRDDWKYSSSGNDNWPYWSPRINNDGNGAVVAKGSIVNGAYGSNNGAAKYSDGTPIPVIDYHNNTYRYYWNSVKYVPTEEMGNTTSYYDIINNAEFVISTYCSWVGGNAFVPTIMPTGTSQFVINYKPVYERIGTLTDNRDNDAVDVLAKIEGPDVWQYTEASVKRAKATIAAMIAANPNNFNYDGTNTAQGVADCAAAIKDAVYMIDHDGLVLEKKQGTVTFVDQLGNTLAINGQPATYTKDYGKTVAANEIPQLSNAYYRADNAEWDYSEDLSWEPALPATIIVNEPEQIYQIHDSQSVQAYTVTFYDEDGSTVLVSGDWYYGDYPDYGSTYIKDALAKDPSLKAEDVDVVTPTKQDYDYNYEVTGWKDGDNNEFSGLNAILNSFIAEGANYNSRAYLAGDKFTKYVAVYEKTARTDADYAAYEAAKAAAEAVRDIEGIKAADAVAIQQIIDQAEALAHDTTVTPSRNYRSDDETGVQNIADAVALLQSVVSTYTDGEGNILDEHKETFTVTVTPGTNTTLTVKNGDTVVNSGDAVLYGTVLTIEAAPAAGYEQSNTVTVKIDGEAYAESTYTVKKAITVSTDDIADDSANRYTVTWVDQWGTVIATASVKHGWATTMPINDPADVRIEDKVWRFDHWDNGLTHGQSVSVTADTIITAIYTLTDEVAKYTVTFLNDDNYTKLAEGEYEWNEPVVVPGTPVSTRRTVALDYTFLGWTPEVAANVTSDATYVATYETQAHDRLYPVKWVYGNEQTVAKAEVLPYSTVFTAENIPADVFVKDDKVTHNKYSWSERNGTAFADHIGASTTEVTIFAVGGSARHEGTPAYEWVGSDEAGYTKCIGTMTCAVCGEELRVECDIDPITHTGENCRDRSYVYYPAYLAGSGEASYFENQYKYVYGDYGDHFYPSTSVEVTWNTDDLTNVTCVITEECAYCGEVRVYNGEVSVYDKTDATCVAPETTVYQATFEHWTTQYSEEIETAQVNPTAHEYYQVNEATTVRPVKDETTGEWSKGELHIGCEHTYDWETGAYDASHDKVIANVDRADYTAYDEAYAKFEAIAALDIDPDTVVTVEIPGGGTQEIPFSQVLAYVTQATDSANGFPQDYTTTHGGEFDEQPIVDQMVEQMGMIIDMIYNEDGTVKDGLLNEYTISFVTDGTAVADVTGAHKGDALTLAASEKDGWHFDGWFTDEERTVAVTLNDEQKYIVTGDATLYAKFTELSLDPDDIDNEIKDIIKDVVDADGNLLYGICYTEESLTAFNDAKAAVEAFKGQTATAETLAAYDAALTALEAAVAGLTVEHDYSGEPVYVAPSYDPATKTYTDGSRTWHCANDATHEDKVETVKSADYTKEGGYQELADEIAKLPTEGDLKDEVKTAIEDVKTALDAISKQYNEDEQADLDAAVAALKTQLDKLIEDYFDKNDEGNLTPKDNALNHYTVKWIVDGVETTEQYLKGDLPDFKGSTEKADDTLYTYTFTGWDPEPLAVTEDATYTAEYSKAYNDHVKEVIEEADKIVNSDDFDDEYTDDVQEQLDVLNDPDAADENKEAALHALEELLKPEIQDANKLYTITWSVNGTSTEETYKAGVTPMFRGNTDREDDELYTYTFTDWDPAIAVVSGNATYTAQYDKDYKQSVKDLIDEAEDVVNDETYDEDYRDDIQDDLDVLADPDATDEEKKAAAEDLEKKLSDEEKEANTLYTLTVYANGAVVRTVRGKEGDRVNLAVPAAPDKFYFTGWTVTAGSVNGNDYTFARADAEAVANFKLDPTVAEDLIDKADDILGEGDDVYEDEYLDELQEKLDELNDAINNGADEETVKNLLDELEAIVNDANNNKHVWGPWEIVKEADFGVTGLKRRYCTKDGCTHYQEMEYNISANLDREIQFTNMHGMHYIAHMGETDRYVYTDSKALKWYSGASLTFNVVTGSTFRYDDYVIFMNGQVLEANADGSFTIPAGDNRVVITIVGAVKGGDDQGATPSSGSGVCKLCGKDHGTTIWGRIVAFFHLIVYFFKNLFK